MRVQLYQVDAFTSKLFAGNPAAVCPLESWLDDHTMQSIAAENNLSETAFLVRSAGAYELRWFTPQMEVDLCGHATLAAAHIIFSRIDSSLERVRFDTRSGTLQVERQGDLLFMDFPARPGKPCPAPAVIAKALGAFPQELYLSRDYLAVFDSEQQIRYMQPDFTAMSALTDCLGVIVTAPGDHTDFVSRFFAPNAGVPEDPVTGSAHCTLVPYWSTRLDKKKLHALQLSQRGGELYCEDLGDRVQIAGEAVIYLEGSIIL
jgi:PhzF family phenazine biosynthesis protein